GHSIKRNDKEHQAGAIRLLENSVIKKFFLSSTTPMSVGVVSSATPMSVSVVSSATPMSVSVVSSATPMSVGVVYNGSIL
ncbi:7568_t:CDS:1, partial [Rhizophagus irregularis]